MRKFILYTSIIIITVIIIIADPGNFFSKRRDSLNISDTASITRIEIYNKDTVVIEKSEKGNWIVNNSFNANRISVNNLFYSVRNLGVKGISYNIENTDSLSSNIKIFSGGKKYFYRFYSGGGKNLIHNEGSKKVYSVEIPGSSEVNLSEIFSTNFDYWRDHTIIDYLPEELQVIKVEHPEFPQNNFVIRFENNIPILFDGDGIMKIPHEEVDSTKLSMYVTYFMNIFYDYSLNINTENITIGKSPDYIITITSIKGDTDALYVFRIYKEDDIDLFNAVLRINNQESMLLTRYIVIDLILRKKSDFLLDES